MYEWVIKRLQYAEMEHIKHGEDKLAVLCQDAADAIEELSKRADEWKMIAEGWQKTCKRLENRIQTQQEPPNWKEKKCEDCYWHKWYRGDLYCTHVGLKTNVNSSCWEWKPMKEE